MSVKKEIVSEMHTIADIMITRDYTFFIPDFQRSFVWNEEEIKQLMEDFEEDTNNFTIESNDLEGYLLGNIVLIEQEGPAMVIDGQQRLTTITLIFRALSKIVNDKAINGSTPQEQNKWVRKIGDLMKGYCVMNDDDEIQSLRLRHDASLHFGNYYNNLLFDREQDSEQGVDSLSISRDNIEDENIYTVYTYAFEYLLGLDDTQLNKFINYFKNKVKLIVTSAPTEAKAFQLFEILNDRGRSLEPMDLIKNSFLKVLYQEGRPKQLIDQFTEKWQDTIANLKIGKKQISSSSFLKQYILSYCGENIQAKDLFDFIKNSKRGFNNGTDIIRFSDGMFRASKLIHKLESKDYSDFADEQNMYLILQLLGIKQFFPILLLFVDETEERKTRILDVLVRYGAAIVFSFTQTNNIEKMLPAIIQEYLEKKNNSRDLAFESIINNFEKEIVEVSNITRAIVSERNFVGRGDLVHSKALQLLRFIELYFNNSNFPYLKWA